MSASGLDNGFGAPYYQVFFGELEISESITDFKYAYDEEDDEICTMTVQLEDRNAPDLPQFQEKAELKTTWGYIQGEVSDRRKVYIQDVKWKYDKDNNVTGTLTCTEKAVSLKFTTSDEVFTNTNMMSVAQTWAARHGLKAYIDIPKEDILSPDDTKLKPLPGEKLDAYIIRSRKSAGTFNPQTEAAKLSMANWRDQKKLEDPSNNKIIFEQPKASLTGTAAIESFKNDLKNYKNLPQANRTPKQLLNDMGRRENPQLFAETRDDELIIKRRNFNQAPYKLYTFGGEVGDLVDFTPMSKNRRNKQHSVNQGFGGWNPMNKTYFQGNANAAGDSDTLLTTFTEAVKFYQSYNAKGEEFGNLVLNGKRVVPRVSTQSPLTIRKNPNQNNVFKAQNYNNAQQGSDARVNSAMEDLNQDLQVVPITVYDKLQALKASAAKYNALVAESNANIYNSMGMNPGDAMNEAMNHMRSKKLKANPATCTIYGDPHLKVGIIITIESVSKKFSGNYYVTKCTHSIDKSSGYMTDLEMVRQGVNIQSTKSHAKHTKLKRKVNKKKGKRIKKTKTKTIGVTSNPTYCNQKEPHVFK